MEPPLTRLAPVVRFAASLPRDGHAATECEDRWALSALRFAVSDGAAGASYSDVWAGILTTAFCKPDGPAGGQIEDWLSAARQAWLEWADGMSARGLPWFTRDTLHDGSFATFVGLMFEADAGRLMWTAVACGDACLFLVRDDTVAVSFPLSAANQFGASPDLVSTFPVDPAALLSLAGAPADDDRYFLATDALAHWFLDQHACGAKPWRQLDRLRTTAEFETFVAAARLARTLRNDDVTLVVLTVAAVE
jgi:hypothetical protein